MAKRRRHQARTTVELAPEAWLGLQLGRTWVGRSRAEINAAHQRAGQLLSGGWGAVEWPETGPGEPEGGQLELL